MSTERTGQASIEDADGKRSFWSQWPILLGLTLTWGVEPENTRAQWFYVRLGATLRDKVVAGWAPEAYRQVVAACATSAVDR